MNQTLAEIVILTFITLSAGLLGFISTVMQRVMEDMPAAEFKALISKLFTYSARDVLSILESMVPFFGVIAYFIAYGFNHWWFIGGFAIWLIASTISKLWNVPIYGKVLSTDAKDEAALTTLRLKLRRANMVRALLTGVAVILILIQFAS